jgi:hypothetical protein
VAGDEDEERHLLADIAPLDVTGVRTVTVGLIAWAVAFVALLPFYDTLRDHGDVWWLWTCVAGFGLGLFGREYCKRREVRLVEVEAGGERPDDGQTR